MSETTTRALANLEYFIVGIDADLEKARDVLKRHAREVPRCGDAAKQLAAIRKRLRQVLDYIDIDTTAAVLARAGAIR